MSKTWEDQPASIRKGEELDIPRLAAFLKGKLPEMGGQLLIEQFPKGYSNLTYLLRLGDKQLVLRRPPFGAKIKSAHDMGREFTILNALSKVYSKVPKPYLYTEDESIIGAPFYIMERIEGIILRSRMPGEMIPGPWLMKSIASGLVDTLVELHEVDYEKAGLAQLGQPKGYVSRQIKGWTKRYFNAKTDEVPSIEKTARWLEENMPNESGAALIHNDFKYDNLVLDVNDWSKIIAVLDWEMSTIGDPMMDLGTSLGYWININDPQWFQSMALSPTTLPGNPSRAEIVEMYAKRSGREIRNIEYYFVYGIFKLAVISQQIYYRYKDGFTKDERFARLGEAVKGLGEISIQAIAKKRIDDLF